MLRAGTEIPTIDVVMAVVRTKGANAQELAITTGSKVGVETQMETTDAVKLVIKGALKAQKPEVNTITGTKLTFTDNVFIPELVKILQGGVIKYNPDNESEIIGYTPPVAGSREKGEIFELDLYSAQYTPAGTIAKYEKCTYPNCQGTPVALSAEDGVFRTSEYTINSAPNDAEAPYDINYVKELPEVNGLVLLNLTASAGASSTKTKISVTPAPSSGESAKYKITGTMPAYDDVLTTGWTAFTANAEITCATGDEIVVAYVDTTNKCKAAGKTTVVVGGA